MAHDGKIKAAEADRPIDRLLMPLHEFAKVIDRATNSDEKALPHEGIERRWATSPSYGVMKRYRPWRQHQGRLFEKVVTTFVRFHRSFAGVAEG